MSIRNATEHECGSAPRRGWWFRLTVLLSLLIAVLVGGPSIFFKADDASAQKELDAVVAELDATDPHWRLEDIEAARKAIPDKENAALVVMAVADHLPKPFPA